MTACEAGRAILSLSCTGGHGGLERLHDGPKDLTLDAGSGLSLWIQLPPRLTLCPSYSFF
jgi:hypothetical protein